MPEQMRESASVGGTSACATCGVAGGTPRVDFHSRSIVALCNDCCDRRAVACPFCDNPFGREVKRASKCKKCGETVARNSRSPTLASRLATQSVCDALGDFESQDYSANEQAWLQGCLLECLLAATKAGRDPRSIDSAFAAALRESFETGLTRERLHHFGFNFALAIWRCGGNPRPIQRTLHRTHLESLRTSGLVRSVEVLPCGDPCKRCSALKGRVWTVAEALQESPLPCRDCLNTNDNGFGWCRCLYQERLDLDDESEAILREAEAELKAEMDAIEKQSIRENREVYERAEAEAARIMGVEGKPRSKGVVPTSRGVATSIEEAAKIASNGWHKAHNRGKHGFNAALEALRAAGISADTTPNLERPVFNDVVLTLKDGSRCVLMFCTTTWEFVVRRD